MSLPWWILASGLGFWGLAVGAWPLAVVSAALMLGPRLVARRMAFGAVEFARVMDFCWLLVFGGLLLTYSRESVGSVLRSFAQWLPLVFLPAVASQTWSEAGRVPMAALLPLPWWRRRDHGSATLDVTGPYLVFCLLSASVAGGGRAWFFAGMLGVASMALWVNRARGAPAWLAALFLLAASTGGWFVSVGLGGLQGWFENRFLNWVTQWRRDDGAFRVARTAIGSTGWVGGSGQVVATLRNEGEARVPSRLRMAVFTTWSEGTWYAPSSPFEKLDGSAGEWTLDDRRGLTGSSRIELRTDVTGGLLAFPGGTRTIGDCPADGMEKTPMGAVRAAFTGSMLPYRVDFGPDAGWEAEPGEDESHEVRQTDRGAIEIVAAELGLAGRSAGEMAERIAAHFGRHFRYTTDLKPSRSKDPRATTPLGRFLLSDREGHCEYFATAAVLLFRTAGVPARYVTGFLVNPTDREGGVYWVRSRHAHAWVRVWMDGKWQDFDPTPSAVFGEVTRVDPWERFWTGLWFSVSRWWWLGEKRWLREAYWLVVPLLVLTAWRFRRIRAAAGARGRAGQPFGRECWPGWDSEWYQVEAGLAGQGWSRGARETVEDWVGRVEREAGASGVRDRLMSARRLHERLRFDPAGIDAGERSELRQVVRDLWEVLGWRDEDSGARPGA